MTCYFMIFFYVGDAFKTYVDTQHGSFVKANSAFMLRSSVVMSNTYFDIFNVGA